MVTAFIYKVNTALKADVNDNNNNVSGNNNGGGNGNGNRNGSTDDSTTSPPPGHTLTGKQEHCTSTPEIYIYIFFWPS